MAQTQARMTALVERALHATIEEMGEIELYESGPNTHNSDSVRKAAEIFTRHLCSLLYPKQEPEVKP